MLMPICRLNDGKLMIQEMVKQRWEPMASSNPGSPGLYEQDFLKTMGKYGDFLISNVPWLNPKSAMTRLAGEAASPPSSPSDQLDINGGFTFEAMLIAAQAWLAAKSTKPDALMDALRKTKIDQHVMVGGPIQFDAKGQNVNIKAAAVAESQAQADGCHAPRVGRGAAGLPEPGWNDKRRSLDHRTPFDLRLSSLARPGRHQGPAHRHGVRADGARPVGDLRRHARGQFRAWRNDGRGHVSRLGGVRVSRPRPRCSRCR